MPFDYKKEFSEFNKRYTDPINSQKFAEELIKHNYRAGWNLPEMPR